MAERVGVFTESTARMMLEMFEQLRGSGLFSGSTNANAPIVPQREFVYVKNVSGEEIPPFACMQATGTTEFGGQNYINVNKPADAVGTAGGYLFNRDRAIAAGEYGVANAGPVARCTPETGSYSAGSYLIPKINSWDVVAGGGGFVYIGGDDIEDGVARILVYGSAPPSLVRFQITGTEWVSNKIAATMRNMDGATIESSDLEDPEIIFSALGENDTGLAIRQQSRYFIIQAPCA